MGKKQHFAIVPDNLIAKRQPKRLQIYCELYMLEVSNQRYNLRHFAEDRNVSYSVAYKLLRQAREILVTSRKKKKSDKKSAKSDKKSAKNNRYEAEEYEAEQSEPEKNRQKDGKNQQKDGEQGQYRAEPVGIPEALKLELELELESNYLTNETESLVSRAVLMAMSPAERGEYIRRHKEALKKEGIL